MTGVWGARATVVVTLAMAVGVLLYRGPGQPWIRGMGGDLLVVIFLVACVASVPVGTPRSRVIGVAIFAFVVECSQSLDLVGPDSPFIAHLILGSTFDPVDLVVYAVGLVIAAGLEAVWRIPPRAQSQPS
jgi:hypothetical protein